MSWNEFYLTAESGSSDLNAGSTSADASGAGAASVTSTNGDWGNAAANRFTAASGTPFSGVSVGQWASVYLDAATTAVYIAQVTAVNAGGAAIDLSSTVKFGSAPANGATGRSCKIGGAWASAAVMSTPFNTGTLTVAVRVNVKAATYANTTSGRTIGTAGATTAPLWFRGYKTSPGDMDAVPVATRTAGTDIPSLTFTTAAFAISGSHVIFSNINVVGARTAGVQTTISGTNVRLHRCRFECTGANAASSSVSVTNPALFSDCWFKATATATNIVADSANTAYRNCTFEGGGNAINKSAGTGSVVGCVFRDNGASGITTATTTLLTVERCSFYSPTVDGIRWTALPSTSIHVVAACIFNDCVWGLNNTTGTNTAFVQRSNNLFYNGTSGTETGFGDFPTFCDQTDSASSFVNAGSGDFTPATASNARNNGAGLFENESFTSYVDVGAVQHTATGGGGGNILHSSIIGGLGVI